MDHSDRGDPQVGRYSGDPTIIQQMPSMPFFTQTLVTLPWVTLLLREKACLREPPSVPP